MIASLATACADTDSIYSAALCDYYCVDTSRVFCCLLQTFRALLPPTHGENGWST